MLVAYPAREWTIAACFTAVRARLAGEGGLLALGIVLLVQAGKLRHHLGGDGVGRVGGTFENHAVSKTCLAIC